MARIISIYGPPDSGKTTVSVALSEVLANKGYNTCIVCCDNKVPTIPVLLPQTVNKVGAPASKVRSIGKVLSCVDFSASDILNQFVYTNKYKNIVLIGYAYGENESSYPLPTDYDAYEFIKKLADMVDYIIVDCGNDITSSLCKVSMEHSDSILRIAGSSYKDIVYYASNESLIPEGAIKKAEHILIAPKMVKQDNMEYLKGFYGEINYKMKYDENVSKMMAFGEYFIKDFPSHYLNEIKKICEEVNFG